jgi:P4 family phage/plasmid primase-like protien
MAREDTDKLISWLRRWYPQDVVMPVAMKTKQPMRSHKANRWSWDALTAFLRSRAGKKPFATGILLREICAIDFDSNELAEQFEARFPILRSVPMETTSKGRHYFLGRPKWADEEGYFDGARQHGQELDVDFKSVCSTGTSGMIVVAPSPGKTWVRPLFACESKLPEIPRELLASIAVPKKKRGGRASKSPAMETLNVHAIDNPAIGSVSREDPLVKLLYLLNKNRWDSRDSWLKIALVLRNEAVSSNCHPDKYRAVWTTLSRISPKFDAAEADKLWESLKDSGAYEGAKITRRTIEVWAGQDDPPGYAAYRANNIHPCVLEFWKKEDRGLAIIAKHGLQDVLKYSDSQYYYYNSKAGLWEERSTKRLYDVLSCALEEALVDVRTALFAKRAAAQAAQGTEMQSKDIDDDIQLVNRRIKYVMQYDGIVKVANYLSSIMEDTGFVHLMDSVPHLLGVANGVVDLRTGQLRERQPDDYIFTVCPIEYNPDADPKVFHDVVLSAMADDQDMAAYLQRLMGYSITGEVSEEIFVVFSGSGRNCKGVITQTLSHILGGLFRDINVAVITDRRAANIDAERARLHGARVAMFNELEPHEKLKTADVKALSGGDAVLAAQKYKDPVAVKPKQLCILSTNHMPELDVIDVAIVQRLVCIHFPVTFTDLPHGVQPSEFVRQRDPELKSRLKSRAQDVLKWFVDGAVAWYANKNLKDGAPAKVKEFSKKYFEDQDVIGSFVETMCDVGNPEARVSSRVFIAALADWGSGQRITERVLADWMKRKGFVKKKAVYGNTNCQCYFGISLKEDDVVAAFPGNTGL